MIWIKKPRRAADTKATCMKEFALVLAGSALIFDSGNIQHAVPIDGREFVQLLKDVVPGMISVVVGFLVLEVSGRLNNGRGLRHG